MTDLEKAARMALEALEYYQVAGLATTRVVDSITALRQAISDSVEQPAQQSAERVEPVDWEAVAADQAMTIALMKGAQEAAVLAEREACAKVCDEAAHDWHQHAKGGPVAVYNACAAAIRARGQA